MKNVWINLLLILFMATSFQGCELVNASEKAAANEMAQLKPAASADAQSVGARVAGEVQLDFQAAEPSDESPWRFFTQNWGVLALSFVAFLEVGARLTPTEKDNTILKILTTVLNAVIPNFRKGGGVF